MTDDGDLTPDEVLTELLEEVVDALDLDGDVIVERIEGNLVGRIEGNELGLLIGRHGQTIDAVQHLAQRIVFPDGSADSGRVIVDAGGYRERRAEELCADADDAAEEALETGKPVELQAMTAQERRVVHEHLRDRDDVETHSEGEEPDRRLVISPSED